VIEVINKKRDKIRMEERKRKCDESSHILSVLLDDFDDDDDDERV
jgi:hypothetical protein